MEVNFFFLNEPAIEKNGASDDRFESGRYTCMKVAIRLKLVKVVGIHYI